jgi:hypothetical protein
MSLSTCDPATMTDKARLAEVAEVLALAFIRLLKSRKESRNCLDESGEHEAPCVHEVNGNSAGTGEEKVA